VVAQAGRRAGIVGQRHASIYYIPLNRKLAFAKEHEPELAAVGAGKDFQAKLEAKLRALATDSGSQEAVIVSLPDNNRAFCEAKGRLYFILKDIIKSRPRPARERTRGSGEVQLEGAVPAGSEGGGGGGRAGAGAGEVAE
jgi:hypothetical protein